MYHFFRKILFLFSPEKAHQIALIGLKLAYHIGLTRFFSQPAPHPRSIMGLTFTNPVGLAAGFDKNGDYIDALSALGFGFIEIGTVTPKPQSGNPQPRLFRIPEHEALINRMGFNNKGVDYVARRLASIKYKGVLGINIGKNKDTPNENAAKDYQYCFQKLAPFASYIVINISSPNTPGLRDLQQIDNLRALLIILKLEQRDFYQQQQKYVPLLVKISPDLTPSEICALAELFIAEGVDGVIATNTTLHRDGLPQSAPDEAGGLSGRPLQKRSTEVIAALRQNLPKNIPIIASGGIIDAESAQEKCLAGAQAVQLYTGLIYHGPRLINAINQGILP